MRKINIRSAACVPMMVFVLLAAMMPSFITTTQAVAQTTPEADPKDVESIDAIIEILYAVISGPAGQERDWDKFRSLFVPDAKLIPVAVPQNDPAVVRIMTVEDFVTNSTPNFMANGFFEREIARKTEQFGHIAHVFTTYDSKRLKSDKEPFARGINSIQLFNDGKRWWIVNIFWDSERPNQPLPDKYLPKKGG